MNLGPGPWGTNWEKFYVENAGGNINIIDSIIRSLDQTHWQKEERQINQMVEREQEQEQERKQEQEQEQLRQLQTHWQCQTTQIRVTHRLPSRWCMNTSPCAVEIHAIQEAGKSGLEELFQKM